MPQRTNEKQQVIEMLKTMLAPHGCTVTPSKLLLDSQLQATREVDVVAETVIDGQVFTQSFEVVDRSRRSDLPWVESMLQKHKNLPTDRLYLVSWSGFTKDAFRLAATSPRTIPVVVKPDGRSGDALRPRDQPTTGREDGELRIASNNTDVAVSQPHARNGPLQLSG
jgi:hypothetical protein